MAVGVCALGGGEGSRCECVVGLGPVLDMQLRQEEDPGSGERPVMCVWMVGGRRGARV